MKNKKLFLIVIVSFVVVLLAMIINKLLILNNYKSEVRNLNTENIFNETITVVNYEKIENSEILTYQGLTMKNQFKEYKTNENNSNLKVKYDTTGNVESFYSINKSQQYIDVLNFNSFKLYIEEDSNEYNFNTNESMKSYLNDKKIENDIDLLNYIKNSYYIKNNIFMNTKTIKNNFLINSFVEVTLPEFNNITLINGRVSGYILNMATNKKEIHILNNDVQYIIMLAGKSITNNEFIMELLETIKF